MLVTTLIQLIFNVKIAYKTVKFVTNLPNVSVASQDSNSIQQLPYASHAQFLTTTVLNALKVNASNADNLFTWIQQQAILVRRAFQQYPTAFNVQTLQLVCNVLQATFQQDQQECLHAVLARQDAHNVFPETIVQNAFQHFSLILLYYARPVNRTALNVRMRILAGHVSLVSIWTAQHVKHVRLC